MPADTQIVLRIGINLGDVTVEGMDIHGDGVNVAARMQEIAKPGEISVSGVVYDSVRDKLAPDFEDLGPQQVKNIAEPVRAYRVVLDPEGAGRRKAPRETPRVATAVSAGGSARELAILSGLQRQGSWRVPKNLCVLAVMGGIDLEFREAVFGPGVSEVNITSVMGGVAVIVPPHLQVGVQRRRHPRQFRRHEPRQCGAGSKRAVAAHYRHRSHGRARNLNPAARRDHEIRSRRPYRPDRSTITDPGVLRAAAN